MSRLGLFPFLVMLLVPTSMVLSGELEESGQSEAAQLSALDSALSIREQTESFDKLVQLTKPEFVWRGGDMLWITHDASGKVGVAMNRAYHLQIADGKSQWYLLEAHDYCTQSDGGVDFPYTRSSDAHPVIIGRDPMRGVVYQARWDSSPESGNGCITDTRNIFLFCDYRHHWHFLGEGPVGSRDTLGVDDYISDSVETNVTWTDDAASPVKLTFALLTKYQWDLDGAPGLPSVTVCRRMVPRQAQGLSRDHGVSPADVADTAPGLFERTGPYYVVAPKTEPLVNFVRRLAHCCDIPLNPNNDDQKDAIVLRAAIKAMQKVNPSLASDIFAGRKIILPESFYANQDPYGPPILVSQHNAR